MRRRDFLGRIAAAPLAGGVVASGEALGRVATGGQEPVAIGTARQLFLDDFWLDRRERIDLTRHAPVLREPAIALDRPWEKKWLSYSTVLQDEGRYRMWYRVTEGLERDSWTCYAESRDGIRWEKPSLGIVDRQGSRDNNIVFEPKLGINASVLRDPNGAADERYKMLVRRAGNLEALVSPDGLRWRPAAANPLLDASLGHYDSHNVLVWDDERAVYVIYMRGFIDETGRLRTTPEWPEVRKQGIRVWRVIRRSESPDFRRWSEPRLVVARDAGDLETLHFYTNAATKYPRAASAFLMFPMVLHVTDRGSKEVGRQFPGTPQPGLSDIHFLTSRDGIHWDRRFRKPLINPGPDPRNWVDRNPIMNPGIVQTGAGEISMYYGELFHERESRLRRCTFRTDGFVSVEGPYAGWGEFTTRPLTFGGSRLEMNYATSGGGTVQVEILDADGTPIPGRALADCPPIFGDRIDGIVRWQQGEDLGSLRGRPVRLRVRLSDAHLYAFRFPA